MNPWQPGMDVRKRTIAVIVIESACESGSLARQQNIQAAIVVIVSPSDRTIVNSLQPGIRVPRERAISLIAIKAGHKPCVRVARQQKIETSIVIIVSPSARTTKKPRQAGIGVGENGCGGQCDQSAKQEEQCTCHKPHADTP